MPCTTLFDRQDAEYRQAVLGQGLVRVAVEAGVTDGWWKYRCDEVIGIDRFGESAPAAQLFELFGITADKVAQAVQTSLAAA